MSINSRNNYAEGLRSFITVVGDVDLKADGDVIKSCQVGYEFLGRTMALRVGIHTMAGHNRIEAALRELELAQLVTDEEKLNFLLVSSLKSVFPPVILEEVAQKIVKELAVDSKSAEV